MISTVKKSIAECREACAIIGNGTVYSNMEVGPNTRRFIAKMQELCDILPASEQRAKDGILQNLNILKTNRLIHPFAFGETKAWLLSLESAFARYDGRKIFISHSSKDKYIVTAFVEKILQLGTRIDGSDIFCTSIEESGIRNGQDMRHHIEKNILGCDLAILLLSKAYNRSPICLNEMGAVWCSQYSDVRIFTLPNLKIPSSIGWLMEPRQVERVDSESALDGLHELLTKAYGLRDDLVAWGRHKREFLQALSKTTRRRFLHFW